MDDKFNDVFSKQLVYYMYSKNISQKALAETIGVSESSVSQWVKGAKVPRADKIDKICDVLGCKRSDLVDEPTENKYSINNSNDLSSGMSQTELFARNLRIYLSYNNLKQSDLCKKFGVSSAAVSDWCNAKKMPQTKKLADIAEYLSVQVNDLFSDTPTDKVYISVDKDILEFIDVIQKATPKQRKFIIDFADKLTKDFS